MDGWIDGWIDEWIDGWMETISVWIKVIVEIGVKNVCIQIIKHTMYLKDDALLAKFAIYLLYFYNA